MPRNLFLRKANMKKPTTRVRKVRMTPLQVYDAFPDTDLLCPVPPKKGETCQKYLERIRDDPHVDSLFKFVISQLCSDDTADEFATNLDASINDLMAVKMAANAGAGNAQQPGLRLRS